MASSNSNNYDFIARLIQKHGTPNAVFANVRKKKRKSKRRVSEGVFWVGFGHSLWQATGTDRRQGQWTSLYSETYEKG